MVFGCIKDLFEVVPNHIRDNMEVDFYLIGPSLLISFVF